MTIRFKQLDTASITYLDETPSRTEQYPSLRAARTIAERYVGNSSYSKLPFDNEECYLYGDGSGATILMVRRDIEIVDG